jgi:hypothetical protein
MSDLVKDRIRIFPLKFLSWSCRSDISSAGWSALAVPMLDRVALRDAPLCRIANQTQPRHRQNYQCVPAFADHRSPMRPKFGVNFTLILQIWPKIEHSYTSCLQQLMDFGKRSLIPPAVLAYEPDGGFSLPSLGSRVS